MFNHMCSIRSSEMNIEEPECKNTNDDLEENIELFNNQLWKDPGSSEKDFSVETSPDKLKNFLSKDNNL